MQSNLFESSALEPVPLSLQMSSYTIPSIQLPAADAAPYRQQQLRLPEESVVSFGFLRGCFWALAIEGFAAFCVYEAWHLWLFLR